MSYYYSNRQNALGPHQNPTTPSPSSAPPPAFHMPSFGASSSFSVPSPQEMADAQANLIRDQVRISLENAPAYARQQWNELSTYAPQQADLFMRLARQYRPQELALNQSLQNQRLPPMAALYRNEARKDRADQLQMAFRIAHRMDDARNAGLSPGARGLQNQLFAQAGEQLAAGSRLTPEQLREVQQGARAGLESRGLNQGLGAASSEGVARAMAGQGLLNQRMGQASALLGQDQEAAKGYNPFQIVAQQSVVPSQTAAGNINAAVASSPQTYGQPISGIPYSLSAVGSGSQAASNNMNSYLGASTNAAQLAQNAQQMAMNNHWQQQAINLGWARLGQV